MITLNDRVTLSLSDEDMCKLVAEALDNNLLYTGGGKTIEVHQIDQADKWTVHFDIHTEDKA